MLNPDGTLAIKAHRGFGAEFLRYFQSVSKDDASACGRALRANAAIMIEDVETDDRFAAHRGIARLAGFRAVDSVPLIAPEGRLLGVLSTHFSKPGGFEPYHHEAFHHLSQQGAAAIRWAVDGGTSRLPFQQADP